MFEDFRDSYYGKKFKVWKSCINILYLKINIWGFLWYLGLVLCWLYCFMIYLEKVKYEWKRLNI